MRAAWLVLAIVLGVATPVAARESPPTHAPAETVDLAASPEQRPVRRCGCGAAGALVLLFLLVPVVLVIGTIALIIRAVRRRNRLRMPGETVTPLAAESMTHAVIGGHLFAIAVSVVVIAILKMSDEGALAVLLAWVPFARTIRLAFATRFLRWLERGLPAQLHDNLLAAGGSYIVVPRRIARQAHAHTVPTAILR